MEELRPDEASATALDLANIPELLHPLFRAMGEPTEDDLAAGRAVFVNADGNVIVKLAMPVTMKTEVHDRVRLRPLKARDYFDGTYGEDAEDPTMMGSLRFASKIASPAGVVDELRCPLDMRAVWFGVIAARKNFSSPRP